MLWMWFGLGQVGAFTRTSGIRADHILWNNSRAAHFGAVRFKGKKEQTAPYLKGAICLPQGLTPASLLAQKKCWHNPPRQSQLQNVVWFLRSGTALQPDTGNCFGCCFHL